MVGLKPNSAKNDEYLKILLDFDYVRFSFTDIHGISRGVAVAKRNVTDFVKQGVFLYQGLLGSGPATESVLHEDMISSGFPNVCFKPRVSTSHAVTWAGNGKYQIGEVLCEAYDLKGRPINVCTVQVAKRQLSRLEEHEYKILSSFEMEFKLLKGQTDEPAFKGNDMLSTLVQAGLEDYYLDLDSSLAASSVEMEKLHTEYGPGMIELTLKPSWGIQIADNVFVFKQAAKEIALQKGLRATFMAKPGEEPYHNGGHFTFSIWSLDGRNLFDDKQEKDGLSMFAKQWTAGLLKHSRAITALCCPTVNCYRRLHNFFVASHDTWGIENRLMSFRVKTYGRYGACIENRIPSAVANPYLVLAATIAAGLDGVENELPCPPESTDMKSGTALPCTLQEALEALQEDQVISKVMGPELLEWFLKIKQECEIDQTPNFEPIVIVPEVLEKEKALYSKL